MTEQNRKLSKLLIPILAGLSITLLTATLPKYIEELEMKCLDVHNFIALVGLVFLLISLYLAWKLYN